MSEPLRHRIEVVEELDAVPVPVRVGRRIALLADHLGMSREAMSGKLLSMIFREGLEWEDLEHLRTLTADAAPDPGEGSGDRRP